MKFKLSKTLCLWKELLQNDCNVIDSWKWRFSPVMFQWGTQCVAKRRQIMEQSIRRAFIKYSKLRLTYPMSSTLFPPPLTLSFLFPAVVHQFMIYHTPFDPECHHFSLFFSPPWTLSLFWDTPWTRKFLGIIFFRCTVFSRKCSGTKTVPYEYFHSEVKVKNTNTTKNVYEWRLISLSVIWWIAFMVGSVCTYFFNPDLFWTEWFESFF